jgi:hypothetical protein
MIDDLIDVLFFSFTPSFRILYGASKYSRKALSNVRPHLVRLVKFWSSFKIY